MQGCHVAFLAFFWKALLVALTLESGFYGGIVTPQFVIGATVRNALAHVLHMDPVLGASIGLVATVAAAFNTPIAAIVIGFELFGISTGVYVFAASSAAYWTVRHRSVYPDQLVTYPKSLLMRLEPGIPLGQERIRVSYFVLKQINKRHSRHKRTPM